MAVVRMVPARHRNRCAGQTRVNPVLCALFECGATSRAMRRYMPIAADPVR
jgi:hypothetical protein